MSSMWALAIACVDAAGFSTVHDISNAFLYLGWAHGVNILCCKRCRYVRWAEAHIKITRATLTIKLDRNWSSFHSSNSTPPLTATGNAIAPSASIEILLCCLRLQSTALCPRASLTFPIAHLPAVDPIRNDASPCISTEWKISNTHAQRSTWSKLVLSSLCFCLHQQSLSFADGHTVSNAPDLFRPPKLSSTGPG